MNNAPDTTTRTLIEIASMVTGPGSPFEGQRSLAIAKAYVAGGLLEKVLRKPPRTQREVEEYVARLAWWIERSMPKKNVKRRRPRRRTRPPG